MKTRLQAKENTSSDFIYSEHSRSQKIPDSSLFTDEKNFIWENWYGKIQNKLEINVDLFSNERVKLSYIHSRLFNDAAKSAVKLKLSWVEESQLNSILSSSLDWVDLSQLKFNSRSNWVAWTQFLKIVYLLICTEFSCKLNLNSISKNRIITCMHEIFAQTEFSRTLI